MHRLVFCALICAASAALAEIPAPYDPNNKATPGVANPKVTQRNIKRTICSDTWVKSQRPSAKYLDEQKARQLKGGKYGSTDPTIFEEDHRIPIEVGGHPRDPKNLWPESTTVRWNAFVKNKLETYVQTEICAGHMKLADGRAIFQRDWTDVFRLYCGPAPGDACNPPGTPSQQIEDPKHPLPQSR